jgi:hypothetical protein
VNIIHELIEQTESAQETPTSLKQSIVDKFVNYYEDDSRDPQIEDFIFPTVTFGMHFGL